MERTGMKRVAPLLLLAVLLTGCAAASASTTAAVQGPATCTGGPVAGAPPQVLANARAIAAVAIGLGLGQQGVLVGILTAYVESDLYNVNVGDMTGPGGTMSSSRGLYQQLDAWGPLADRMDPTKSATMFYKGGQGGQKGLMSVPGWQQMPPEIAMQAVQQSEFSQLPGNQSPGLAARLAFAKSLADAVGPSCTVAPTGVGAGMTQNPSQDPTTFGWVRAGPQEPFVWQGHNFGQVAQGTSKLWAAFLTEIVPTIPGGLDSNIGCYDDRQNVNSPSKASFHAFGLACDLNSDVNPNGSDPASLHGQYVIPMTAGTVAAKYGLTWGGTFTGTKDSMHFELHLTPQQVAAFTQGTSQ